MTVTFTPVAVQTYSGTVTVNSPLDKTIVELPGTDADADKLPAAARAALQEPLPQ